MGCTSRGCLRRPFTIFLLFVTASVCSWAATVGRVVRDGNGQHKDRLRLLRVRDVYRNSTFKRSDHVRLPSSKPSLDLKKRHLKREAVGDVNSGRDKRATTLIKKRNSNLTLQAFSSGVTQQPIMSELVKDGQHPKMETRSVVIVSLSVNDTANKEEIINKSDQKAEKADQSATKSFDQSVIKKKDKSATKKADQSVMKKTDQSAMKKTDQSAMKKTDQSAMKKTDQSAMKKTDQSAMKKTDQSAKKKVDQSVMNNFGQSVMKKPNKSAMNNFDQTVTKKPDKSSIKKANHSNTKVEPPTELTKTIGRQLGNTVHTFKKQKTTGKPLSLVKLSSRKPGFPLKNSIYPEQKNNNWSTKMHIRQMKNYVRPMKVSGRRVKKPHRARKNVDRTMNISHWTMKKYRRPIKSSKTDDWRVKKFDRPMKNTDLSMKFSGHPARSIDLLRKQSDPPTVNTDWSMKKNGRSLKNADWSTKKHGRSMKNADWSTKKHARSMKNVDWSVKKHGRSMKNADWSLKKYGRSMKNADWSVKKHGRSMKNGDWSVEKHGRSMKNSDWSVKKYGRSMKNDDWSVKKHGRSMKNVDRSTKKYGRSMKNVDWSTKKSGSPVKKEEKPVRNTAQTTKSEDTPKKNADRLEITTDRAVESKSTIYLQNIIDAGRKTQNSDQKQSVKMTKSKGKPEKNADRLEITKGRSVENKPTLYVQKIESAGRKTQNSDQQQSAKNVLQMQVSPNSRFPVMKSRRRQRRDATKTFAEVPAVDRQGNDEEAEIQLKQASGQRHNGSHILSRDKNTDFIGDGKSGKNRRKKRDATHVENVLVAPNSSPEDIPSLNLFKRNSGDDYSADDDDDDVAQNSLPEVIPSLNRFKQNSSNDDDDDDDVAQNSSPEVIQSLNRLKRSFGNDDDDDDDDVAVAEGTGRNGRGSGERDKRHLHLSEIVGAADDNDDEDDYDEMDDETGDGVVGDLVDTISLDDDLGTDDDFLTVRDERDTEQPDKEKHHRTHRDKRGADNDDDDYGGVDDEDDDGDDNNDNDKEGRRNGDDNDNNDNDGAGNGYDDKDDVDNDADENDDTGLNVDFAFARKKRREADLDFMDYDIDERDDDYDFTRFRRQTEAKDKEENGGKRAAPTSQNGTSTAGKVMADAANHLDARDVTDQLLVEVGAGDGIVAGGYGLDGVGDGGLDAGDGGLYGSDGNLVNSVTLLGAVEDGIAAAGGYGRDGGEAEDVVGDEDFDGGLDGTDGNLVNSVTLRKKRRALEILHSIANNIEQQSDPSDADLTLQTYVSHKSLAGLETESNDAEQHSSPDSQQYTASRENYETKVNTQNHQTNANTPNYQTKANTPKYQTDANTQNNSSVLASFDTNGGISPKGETSNDYDQVEVDDSVETDVDYYTGSSDEMDRQESMTHYDASLGSTILPINANHYFDSAKGNEPTQAESERRSTNLSEPENMQNGSSPENLHMVGLLRKNGGRHKRQRLVKRSSSIFRDSGDDDDEVRTDENGAIIVERASQRRKKAHSRSKKRDIPRSNPVKPHPISVERSSRPISVERSRPISVERSPQPISIERSRPISVERSRPISVERSRPISVERSHQPVIVERSQPIVKRHASHDGEAADADHDNIENSDENEENIKRNQGDGHSNSHMVLTRKAATVERSPHRTLRVNRASSDKKLSLDPIRRIKQKDPRARRQTTRRRSLKETSRSHAEEEKQASGEPISVERHTRPKPIARDVHRRLQGDNKVYDRARYTKNRRDARSRRSANLSPRRVMPNIPPPAGFEPPLSNFGDYMIEEKDVEEKDDTEKDDDESKKDDDDSEKEDDSEKDSENDAAVFLRPSHGVPISSPDPNSPASDAVGSSDDRVKAGGVALNKNAWPQKHHHSSERPHDSSGILQDSKGRPQDFSDRPRDSSGILQDSQERLPDALERPQDFSDRPRDSSDRPRDFSDRPRDSSDRPRDFSDRPQKDSSDSRRDSSPNKPEDSISKEESSYGSSEAPSDFAVEWALDDNDNIDDRGAFGADVDSDDVIDGERRQPFDVITHTENTGSLKLRVKRDDLDEDDEEPLFIDDNLATAKRPRRQSFDIITDIVDSDDDLDVDDDVDGDDDDDNVNGDDDDDETVDLNMFNR